MDSSAAQLKPNEYLNFEMSIQFNSIHLFQQRTDSDMYI